MTTGSHFGARPTLAGVDYEPLEDLQSHDVVILGAPFDWGTTYRPGARFGPKAIRESDYLSPDGSRPDLATGLDPFEMLDVVDVGDLALTPGYVEDSLEVIADGVEQIARGRAVPVVLGGDHTITYASAKGVARVHGNGEFALVHFDAHADTGEDHFGALYGHGTPMRRLIEEGAVPGNRFTQIGLRGYWPPPNVVQWMESQSMRWYLMSEIAERGLSTVLDETTTRAEQAAGVYLSVDIDVVDPGSAPGTGTPEPGGMMPAELLGAVRRLARDLPVIAVDLVEVNPSFDGPGAVTSFLANRIVLQALVGIAERRQGR